MTNTDTEKFKNIISPTEAAKKLESFKDSLDEYVSKGLEEGVAFEVTDPKIINMWRKKIKPFSDKIIPLGNELLPMEEELKRVEDSYLELRKKCEEKKEEIENIIRQRSKFINRISPLIIREYKPLMDEFQEFTSIDEHEGKVYVFVKNWLASYISGFRKKAEKHEERVTEKIINPKIAN